MCARCGTPVGCCRGRRRRRGQRRARRPRALAVRSRAGRRGDRRRQRRASRGGAASTTGGAAPGWAGAALDATWGLVGHHGLARGARREPVPRRPGLPPGTERAAGPARVPARLLTAEASSRSPRATRSPTHARSRTARRRSLIERHEGLHVWQQRWFGPIFPIVYGAWMVGGAITGAGGVAAPSRRTASRSSSNGTPTTTTRSSTGRTRPTTTGRRTA